MEAEGGARAPETSNKGASAAADTAQRWRDALTPLVIVAAALGAIALVVVAVTTDASWPVLVAAGLGLLGLLLCLPLGHEGSTRADFGIGLATGALITGMFFILTVQDEQTQANVAHAEELALQLTLQRNLSGIDLSNRRLRRFDLGGKNLDGAQMYGVDLTHAQLPATTLDAAKLNVAKLAFAQMRGASFAGASLAGANLDNANLNEGSLRGANAGMYVLNAGSHPFASFRNAQLVDVDMRGACLAGADLRGADLGAANLQNADLDYAKLQGATFDSAEVPPNLAGASFYGAQLGAHPRDGAPSVALTRQRAHAPSSPAVPGNAGYDKVVAIYSGDTIKLAHLGWARLIGVDTPNLNDRSQAPTADRVGHRALELTQSMTPVGSEVRYTPPKPQREDKPGATGRRLIYLWSSHGRLLNQALLADGLGLRETDQRAGNAYPRRFSAAQTEARENGLGVWATCPDFPANDAVLLPRSRSRRR